MNQTVTLRLTALASLVIGAAGSYAYSNSIRANKIADLNGQIATLQKQITEFKAAAKLDVPTDEQATAAIRKSLFSSGTMKITECQKDAITPGVVCSGLVTTEYNKDIPKVLRFVKIDGAWTSQN